MILIHYLRNIAQKLQFFHVNLSLKFFVLSFFENFIVSTNLLHSWQDAYYSTNMSQIEHVIQIFTRLYRESYLLDHLIDILVSDNYFKFQLNIIIFK